MITVFTPTYNRASTLLRLYESLQRQTLSDFEWIVVDDGSTDGTGRLCRQWQKENKKFSFQYIYQENQGKHAAINRGVREAHGDAFFIVDSDDCLPPDSLQKTMEIFNQIALDDRFAGICGLRADMHNYLPLGNTEAVANRDCSMVDVREKYHIRGDMAEIFKTNILKKYPFPVFRGEKFLNEAVVWNQIAEKYILRYVPLILYYNEYRPDGLTYNIRKKYRQSPKGTMLLYKNIWTSRQFPLRRKIRAAVLYWRYLCACREAYPPPFWWLWLFLPLGIVLFLCDKQKEKETLCAK